MPAAFSMLDLQGAMKGASQAAWWGKQLVCSTCKKDNHQQPPVQVDVTTSSLWCHVHRLSRYSCCCSQRPSEAGNFRVLHMIRVMLTVAAAPL
jgi:hypothetical protein